MRVALRPLDRKVSAEKSSNPAIDENVNDNCSFEIYFDASNAVAGTYSWFKN